MYCGNFPYYIDGLVQERCNSSVLAVELHLSCTNPSIYATGSMMLMFCVTQYWTDLNLSRIDYCWTMTTVTLCIGLRFWPEILNPDQFLVHPFSLPWTLLIMHLALLPFPWCVCTDDNIPRMTCVVEGSHSLGWILFTDSLLLNVEVILGHLSNSFYELMSFLSFSVKMVFGECHRTPLMISQHWFNNGLLLSFSIHNCWRPYSLCCQAISHHGIDFVIR